MKTDKDNLWRENEGREARSKHSEIMAKRIEASDGETTTEWRNRRHPDGDFVSTKKIKNQQRFLLRPWSSAEINAHGSDLIWSNLIWSIVIRRWRIDLWHTSHSSNVSLSLSATVVRHAVVAAVCDVCRRLLPSCTPPPSCCCRLLPRCRLWRPSPSAAVGVLDDLLQFVIIRCSRHCRCRALLLLVSWGCRVSRFFSWRRILVLLACSSCAKCRCDYDITQTRLSLEPIYFILFFLFLLTLQCLNERNTRIHKTRL